MITMYESINESDDIILSESENINPCRLLMETVIYATECEHKLFDSMMKVRYATATINEADAEAVNDKAKESKLAKIKEVADKLIAAISDAIGMAIEKIINFIKINEKIVKKAAPLIKKVTSNSSALDNFPGIKDFALPTNEFDKAVDYIHKLISDFGTIELNVNDACSNINSILFNEKVELYKPSSAEITKDIAKIESILSNASNNEVVQNLKKSNFTLKTGLKNVKNADIDPDIDNKIGFAKNMVKIINYAINEIFATFKADRKYYLSVLAYAKKYAGNTEEGSNDNVDTDEFNEATIYMVQESSDIFCDNYFGF